MTLKLIARVMPLGASAARARLNRVSTSSLVLTLAGLLVAAMPPRTEAQELSRNYPITSPDDARTWGLDSLGNLMQGRMASYRNPDGDHLVLSPRYRVPLPDNLHQFIKDRKVVLALGKALFWDMQVGSDGIQACATCHFQAGGDVRTKNQVVTQGGRVKERRDGDIRLHVGQRHFH